MHQKLLPSWVHASCCRALTRAMPRGVKCVVGLRIGQLLLTAGAGRHAGDGRAAGRVSLLNKQAGRCKVRAHQKLSSALPLQGARVCIRAASAVRTSHWGVRSYMARPPSHNRTVDYWLHCRFVEFLHAEHPSIRAMAMHPGGVASGKLPPSASPLGDVPIGSDDLRAPMLLRPRAPGSLPGGTQPAAAPGR